MKLRRLFLLLTILLNTAGSLYAAASDDLHEADAMKSLCMAILLYQADKVEQLLAEYPELLRYENKELKYYLIAKERNLDECLLLIQEEHTYKQYPDYYAIATDGTFIYAERDVSRSVFFDSIISREDFGRQNGNEIRAIWIKKEVARSEGECEKISAFMPLLSKSYNRIKNAIDAARERVSVGGDASAGAGDGRRAAGGAAERPVG